jgi:hypothetical protein
LRNAWKLTETFDTMGAIINGFAAFQPNMIHIPSASVA